MKATLILITSLLVFISCNQNQKNHSNNVKKEIIPINYCDCEVINREDGTNVTQCIPLPVASDKLLEVGLAIASNEIDKYVTVTIRFLGSALRIKDDFNIRLKDNSMITLKLVNEGLSYIGNSQVAQAVFSLSNSQIQKISNSELLTISLRLEDNLIHTLDCTKNISILKEQIQCITKQRNENRVFKSNLYNYEIVIPNKFEKKEATSKNIDLKLVNEDGESIIINVSKRLQEEYNITAHDYTIEMVENSLKQFNAEIVITNSEKIFIDKKEAFLIYYLNPSNSTKALEIYFYYGSNAYVLTATAKLDKFSEYENVFLDTFNSLKF